MRNTPLYSSSRHRAAEPPPEPAAPAQVTETQSTPPPASRLARAASRWERPLLILFGGIVALLAMMIHGNSQPGQRPLTQKDIDAAVMHTFETQTLPSQASR